MSKQFHLKTKRMKTGRQDIVAYYLPPEVRYTFWAWASGLKRDGLEPLVTLDIEVYSENRTTGPHSQWNHIVGHATQIGEEAGYTWREVLIDILCDIAEYPKVVMASGRVIPKDYKAMTKEQASIVIEALHARAAFLNLVLRED